MKYICSKTFDKKAIDGNIIVPHGAELNCEENVLIYNGKRICYATSANAYAHFALNDDNKGEERYAKTQAILAKIAELNKDYGESVNAILSQIDREDEEQVAQAEAQIAELENKVGEFFDHLKETPSWAKCATFQEDGTRTFNRNFYEAPVSTLGAMLSYLG